MERHLATTGAVVAVLTAMTQLDELYAKQLKLRALEIDLKSEQTPADRALRQYLLQELRKGSN